MRKVINIIKKIMRFCCTFICLRITKGHGKRICVNAPCRFSLNTVIGDNCHFNGIYIHRVGKVTIGDNFHSGSGFNLFKSYHNYSRGTKLPYHDTMYSRGIAIEKNVWLG